MSTKNLCHREKIVESQSIVFKFKQMKWIRVIVFPAINTIRIVRKWTYRFSKESQKIKSLKCTHAGERCFIIGNGPSLTADDLDLLIDEYCFGANRIYKIFDKTQWRPRAYLCVDSYVFRDIKKEIEQLKIPDIYIQLENKKDRFCNSYSNVRYINNYSPFYVNRYKQLRIDFSQDISKYFIAGETVVYTAVQLAVYMGFKEIYLLGVDHNYSKKMDSKGNLIVDNSIQDYFGQIPANDYSIQNFETSTKAYKKAREYCEEHGVIIKNLTRGGKLEVFERDTLKNILN